MLSPSWTPIVGALAWTIAFVLFPHFSNFNSTSDTIATLLMLAPLVVVPLALGLRSPAAGNLDTGIIDRRMRVFLRFALFPAALLVPVSFSLPQGAVATMMVIPWLLVTLLIAFVGGRRLLRERFAPIWSGAIDIGFLYIAVGGIWLVISRAGMTPLDFPPIIVLLTAVHFHYAGFTVNVIAGVVGRDAIAGRSKAEGGGVRERLYGVAAWAVMLNPIVVALGISFSPLMELLGALLLAAGLTLFAAIMLIVGLPEMQSIPGRILVAISSLSLFATMTFAALYAWGEYSGYALVNIVEMVDTHGIINAVGFGLCGTLGWSLEQRSRRRNG